MKKTERKEKWHFVDLDICYCEGRDCELCKSCVRNINNYRDVTSTYLSFFANPPYRGPKRGCEAYLPNKEK